MSKQYYELVGGMVFLQGENGIEQHVKGDVVLLSAKAATVLRGKVVARPDFIPTDSTVSHGPPRRLIPDEDTSLGDLSALDALLDEDELKVGRPTEEDLKNPGKTNVVLIGKEGNDVPMSENDDEEDENEDEAIVIEDDEVVQKPKAESLGGGWYRLADGRKVRKIAAIAEGYEV